MQEMELGPNDVTNPYPLYARMRGHAGLTRHRTDKFLFVSRYRDVREASMRRDDFSSAIISAMVRSNRVLSRLPDSVASSLEALTVADDSSHELHRRLMKRHFTRNPVIDVTTRVTPIVDRRIDEFVHGGGGDFAAKLSSVVPIEATLELLGFPLSDAPKLKHMVDGCVELMAGQLPRKQRMSALAASLQLYGYAYTRVRKLKAQPHAATPVCAALVEAMQDRIISESLASNLVCQLIAAGVDSTSSLLGNAVRMLAESPELAEQLRSDLTLVPAFLEECLRLESPFQGHFRVVRRPTTLAGEELQPGQRLMLMWGAANRDPEAFEKPDALILNRPRTAGAHIAFGYGYHLCLGAELARTLARHVVTRVLQSTKAVALADRPPRLRPTPYLRTLTSLPLRTLAA